MPGNQNPDHRDETLHEALGRLNEPAPYRTSTSAVILLCGAVMVGFLFLSTAFGSGESWLKTSPAMALLALVVGTALLSYVVVRLVRWKEQTDAARRKAAGKPARKMRTSTGVLLFGAALFGLASVVIVSNCLQGECTGGHSWRTNPWVGMVGGALVSYACLRAVWRRWRNRNTDASNAAPSRDGPIQ